MRFLLCATLLSLGYIGYINGQVTFRVTDLPKSTPPDTEIFISGDFEGWSGGSDQYRLDLLGDHNYIITLPQQSGDIRFKFTRGSWASVEKGKHGEEISNRVYSFGGNGDTVEIIILNWADSGEGSSTATENVSIMADAFVMPQFGGRERKIWLYLPPDYATSSKNYPVLYMHDGQNIFDDSTSFAGEWHVDETLNTLFQEENIALIVIGIENGGSKRINEYSPWVNSSFGGGEGVEYIEFITETLKPYVDKNYRTLTSNEDTGLMGSSMGGLTSHYGALANPTVFGKIGVFSPSFWFSDSSYLFGHENAELSNTKMYFLAGGMESSQTDVPANTQAMIDTMIAGGYNPSGVLLKVDPAGTHSEGFWSDEFADAIKWLFGDSIVSTHLIPQQSYGLDVEVYPNPTRDTFQVIPPDSEQSYHLQLFNSAGQIILDQYIVGPTSIDTQKFGVGMFILRISDGDSYSVINMVFN